MANTLINEMKNSFEKCYNNLTFNRATRINRYFIKVISSLLIEIVVKKKLFSYELPPSIGN